MLHPYAIKEYQIRSVTGDIQVHPVKDMEQLVTFIHTHGLSQIAKVSFYIVNESADGTYRNVILRNNDNNCFVPELCDADLSYNDWQLVLEALQYGNLEDEFVRYIYTPQNI